jgi:8-oxo-dGTP diphosphatase
MRVAVDAVIFGYDKKSVKLKILLIKRKYEPFKDSWALPGGFVLENETIDESINREIKEETGLNNVYMEQLYTFGEVERDPRERIISVSYYGLVNTTELTASTDAIDAKWFSFSELPELGFDHKKIIDVAYKRLQGKITYQPIGFELLEEIFTMPHILSLYETILQKQIDKRNFRKKILSFDILDDMGIRDSDKRGRPAKLYKFNEEKYNQKLKEGIYFEI